MPVGPQRTRNLCFHKMQFYKPVRKRYYNGSRQAPARLPHLARQVISNGTQKLRVLHISFVMFHAEKCIDLDLCTDVVGTLNELEPQIGTHSPKGCPPLFYIIKRLFHPTTSCVPWHRKDSRELRLRFACETGKLTELQDIEKSAPLTKFSF